MNTAEHRTGTVRSGDVDIFYRHFGAPGLAPIVITHGANYYDSWDWIDVAAALAADREVIAYDTRGFGRSDWSPAKNYGPDAQMADINAVLDRQGWDKAIIMGHSQGGGRAILFGSRFAARVAGVVIVDHCPGRAATGPAAAKQSVDNPALVFATVEAAMESMSRDENVPEGSPARDRLDAILTEVDGGLVYPRDPDSTNPVPVGPVGIKGWTPEIEVADMWAELAAIKSPTMIIRATRSNRYGPEALARVRDEYPDIMLVDVDSGHDVAGAAPAELIAAVKGFLAERLDAEPAAAT